MANKKQSGFGKWASSRKGQQVIICAAFAIIPLLLLLVFTYIPFGEMVKFSFYKMKYTTPVEKREFVGLANYIDVFTRKDCFGALKLSLYYIVGALVQLVLALFLATLLSFKVKGGNLFKGFIFFPYLISGIAVGFIFKFFFTRGFVFDSILQLCGFSSFQVKELRQMLHLFSQLIRRFLQLEQALHMYLHSLEDLMI